ncbi:hypothetical protein BDB01DRAFT_849959 [Pilobolus umbonatus]|nr:hypothetical protein BDB01DRAFT_849959 [Pilobolus umbonatus]
MSTDELNEDLNHMTLSNQHDDVSHTDDRMDTDIPPFDFHRFLEQIKDPSAKPIHKSTSDFILVFHKKEGLTVNEQIEWIQDFLHSNYIKMRSCDVWRDISDKEFENTKEGLEKLVMNRLYNDTFSPSTTDDKEKDEIIHHKIKIFRWIRESHLDIPNSPDNDSFLSFAESELIKMNSYKAPRDKLICILNCCKIIFGLLKHMGQSDGADAFFPLLIYVLIRANPPRLISNVQYIYRFRSPNHLKSEAAYYLANLMAAISFIETMDVNSLSISKEEFDANIETTMQELKSEQPEMNTDKQPVSYENALHPVHAKRSLKEQPLLELGTDIANKSRQFVEKLFDSQPEQVKQRHDGMDDPSSLTQKLPVPTESMINTQQNRQKRSSIVDDESRKKFDENLSTIVSMFSNIEPDVCFMILQASNGQLQQTIDRLLEMSNEQAM